jgi:hypothetical protein
MNNRDKEKEYFRRNVYPQYITKPLTRCECEEKLEALNTSKNRVLAVLRKLNTEIAVLEGLMNGQK